jgi:tetratricopeptide (TPR) repeat protein
VSNVNYVQTTAECVEGIATVEALPTAVTDIKPPALTSTSVSEAHFQHGFHLFEAGRVEDAVKSLQMAVQYNPEHARAHHFLGVSYASSGRHQQAIEHFVKTTKLAPLEDKLVQESFYRLGQSHIALGQYKNVVAAMDKMIKVNSNDPSVHYNRGYALMMLEIFDYSVRCLDVVLHLDPKHLSALQCKAYCFIQQKKYTQALELLETALEINPKHATSLSYKQFARKQYMRQRGVYAFEEIFPTSAERQKQLPVRFRRSLLPSVLLRPTK